MSHFQQDNDTISDIPISNENSSSVFSSWQSILVLVELVGFFFLGSWLIWKNRNNKVEHYPTKFWSNTSNRYISPKLLLYFRRITFFYFLILQIYQFIDMGLDMLRFYTIWNFILQIIYFAMVLKQSKYHLNQAKLPKAWRNSVLPIIFSIVLPTSFFIAIMVWTVLYPMSIKTGTTKDYLNFVSYNQHGINCILLLIEFWMNRALIHFLHIGYIILWPVIYGIFAIIYYAISHEWIYPILNLQDPYAPLWYLAVLIGHVLCYTFTVCLSKAKLKCMGNSMLPTTKPNETSSLLGSL